MSHRTLLKILFTVSIGLLIVSLWCEPQETRDRIAASGGIILIATWLIGFCGDVI